MNEAAECVGSGPVTLVLGAGGPVAHAFHAGVLRALMDGAGWDARHAELVIGTSAGAQAGALLRAGLSAHDLYARATGKPLSRSGHAIAGDVSWWPRLAPAIAVRRRPWPASPSYLGRVARRPRRARLGHLVAALLPEGRRENAALGDAFAALHPDRWPEGRLWITAVQLDTGARVVFGRHGAPVVDVGTAVRCSSAVPGLRAPVRCGGTRYVDGGIASATHLDLATHGLAVVMSPLSRFWPLGPLLRAEARRLARRGIRTMVFEPDAEVAAAMGWNPFDVRATPRVAEAAYRFALRRLGKSAPKGSA